MKKVIFVSSLILLNSVGWCQTSTVAKLKRIQTRHLELETNDINAINIPMDFNDAIPKEKLKNIDLTKIETITLVYTKFKVSEAFNQLNLNNERIGYLYAALPGLKEQKNIQWLWVEQTGCTSPADCKDYFHGLIIKVKSDEQILKEKIEEASLTYYVDLYSGKTPDTKMMDSLSTLKGSTIVKECKDIVIQAKNSRNRLGQPRKWKDELRGKTLSLVKKELKNNEEIQLVLEVDKKGNIKSIDGAENLRKYEKIEKLLSNDLKFTRTLYNGKSVESTIHLKIYSLDNKIKTTFIVNPKLPDGLVFDIDSFNFKTRVETHCYYIDTSKKNYVNDYNQPVVTKVLDRNKDWKNCLVVTDVTGSMAPYLGQFLFWHKLNLNANSSNSRFVFFNDGDNMSDKLKVTGKVGGIYAEKTTDYKEMEATLKEAQKNGGGGDGPENNVEAILEGLRLFPDCKEIIMIADNWATPRDLKLLEKVNRPVHIILCGSGSGINMEYMNMALATGGSIHTIEKDIVKLTDMLENQVLEIDNQKFKVVKGAFVLQK